MQTLHTKSVIICIFRILVQLLCDSDISPIYNSDNSVIRDSTKQRYDFSEGPMYGKNFNSVRENAFYRINIHWYFSTGNRISFQQLCFCSTYRTCVFKYNRIILWSMFTRYIVFEYKLRQY